MGWPYQITHSHPEASSYTLDILTNTYLVYHVSELKTYIPDDPTLLPQHQFSQPRPILTADGLEEHAIDKMINSHVDGNSLYTGPVMAHTTMNGTCSRPQRL